MIGLEFGSVIAFAIVTETIFAWPGMGKLLIDSINLLDRPVIVAYLMMIVFMFIVINLWSTFSTRCSIRACACARRRALATRRMAAPRRRRSSASYRTSSANPIAVFGLTLLAR